MAVYERSWRRYQGPQTALPSRFSVVTRYALAEAFASRLFTAFYAVCFLPSVGGLFFIYLSHNASLLQTLGAPPDMMKVLTSQFFMVAGKADTQPLFPDDPYIAANRRVTITLINEEPPIPVSAKP